MSHYESMRPTTKACICNKRDCFTKTSSYDCTCWFQHFRHTGCSFRADIPDHDDISGMHFPGLNSTDQIMFAVKNSCCSFKSFSLFACDLRNTSSFSKIPIEYL